METLKVPLDPEIRNCPALKNRVVLREMNAEDWIVRHASGTLRKNKEVGMAWRAQYLEERIAYEFGWCFECLPRSRVTFGDAYTEGNCQPITEAGWLCERYISMLIFPEDHCEVKYINADYGDDEVREGIGLIVRQTSAPWVPDGHIVFAIVAEFDPVRRKFKRAQNPS
jgi:hypothetical protein